MQLFDFSQNERAKCHYYNYHNSNDNSYNNNYYYYFLFFKYSNYNYNNSYYYHYSYKPFLYMSTKMAKIVQNAPSWHKFRFCTKPGTENLILDSVFKPEVQMRLFLRMRNRKLGKISEAEAFCQNFTSKKETSHVQYS